MGTSKVKVWGIGEKSRLLRDIAAGRPEDELAARFNISATTVAKKRRRLESLGPPPGDRALTLHR